MARGEGVILGAKELPEHFIFKAEKLSTLGGNRGLDSKKLINSSV